MASVRGSLGCSLGRRRLPVNSFSYEIDIKRFQNLLETSVDETERRVIEKLLVEETAKAALQASEPKKE
jgi:hypothetical protein